MGAIVLVLALAVMLPIVDEPVDPLARQMAFSVHNCAVTATFRVQTVTASRLPAAAFALIAALCAPARDGGEGNAPAAGGFRPARDAARISTPRCDRARRPPQRTGRCRRSVVRWCRVMDRFFAANRDVRQLRDANYVLLKVNYSDENRNEAFLRRFPPVAGYPHFFVLDTTGRLLHSQDTSVLEAGKDYDAAAMRAFLVKWAPAK
jgi:hypothetical protein